MFVGFFFNDTATTEIYTLSLHDALPIWRPSFEPGRCLRPTSHHVAPSHRSVNASTTCLIHAAICSCSFNSSVDRKSTRLNSSHANISYAVFCLNKKKYEPGARPYPLVRR